MKSVLNRKILATVSTALLGLALAGNARAELADIANVPLANSPSDAVLPNLMYILDDSGSMMWDYMPDNVHTLSDGTSINNCKNSSGAVAAVQCANLPSFIGQSAWGEPPYYSPQFNQIYYNPDIAYAPGVDALGISKGNASPTGAWDDAYINTGTTVNLTTSYPELYYCTTSSPTTANLSDTTVCRRNGINNPQASPNNYFLYWSNNTTTGTPLGAYPTGSFTNRVVKNNGHPYYFTITPHEYCSDSNLTTCALANANGTAPSGFSIPAPIRYCKTTADAGSTSAVTGGSPVKCRKKYDKTNYAYPRYGRFTRVDIVATTVTYPKSANAVRPDCANATYCTYAEELQNFANWYSYYRTRMATMKTATGRAFLPIDSRYRVGFITINPGPSSNGGSVDSTHPVTSGKYLALATYDATQKGSFYTKLYSQSNNGSTPLREALSRVGRHYAGITTGINNGMSTDPILFSCQQNFSLLTTDGYYNDSTSDALKPNNTTVGNQDNVPDTTAPIFVSRATVTLDGIGTNFTNVSPTTIVEQTVCSANSTTSFSGAAQTSCGCATGQRRVKERTTTQTTTSSGTDGVTSTTNTSNSYAYRDVTACNSLVTTAVTPVTIVEQQVVAKGSSSTFATVNGVSAGANQAGSCATNGYKNIKQRTTTYNSTVVTTDGVAAPATNSGTTYSFADIGSCVSPTVVTQTTTPVTVTETQICSGNGTITFADGQTESCACNGSRKVAVKETRTLATRTVTITDGVQTGNVISGGTVVKTYSTSTTAGSGFSLIEPTGNSCSSSGSITNQIASQSITGGITVSSTSGGPAPVPAATTTTTGATTTTSNGGTTITSANFDPAVSPPNPNPAVTPGVTTSTSVPGGTANTLADVAMYYYKTDLRTTGVLAPDNVPTNDKDIASTQHMVTFTLGLGLQGLMDYQSNYESALTGDFANIRNAATNCSWSAVGATCNWPTPVAGTPTTLDDLWHAAVNGRGIYYSASDPNSLADGLSGALAALKVQTAAASASATSSPNITQTDNYIYSSTFRTVKWDGEIVAQRIDTTTGNVIPTIVWSAQALLDTQVADTSDGRTIYTFSSSASNKLKTFVWGNLTGTEQAFFANKCTGLSQCALLSAAQQTLANDGQNMVNYLRGQKLYDGALYRLRDHVLGDPVNATPAFIKVPEFSFNDAVTPSYSAFKAANANRQGVLYIAANDGMLHAFNGDTGVEMWAYIPRMVMPNLYKLATDNWDVAHQYSVDGSPQIMDVFDSGASAWKTVLVAGLNAGGRGYYALDITDPNNPKALWEICSDSTLCALSDTDIGLTYGYPVVTKRPTDGKWVVLFTSGMNNVTPGTGHGFLYVRDALTGAALQKVDTGVGDTTTPSGLSRISAFANSFNTDNTATYVYGGDLLGNLWRFDMSVSTPAIFQLAVLTDSAGKLQPITTRPELSVINGYRVVYVGTGRYLGTNDLVDPATLSPPLPWAYQQSLYAIKDRNVANGNIRTATPGLVQQTINTVSATTRSTTSNTVDWATKDGWYVDFNPGGASPGERVNLDPQLALGTLVVATNVPNNGACTVGGDSWLYQLDYKSGTYVGSASGAIAAQKFTGQTLVGIVVVRLPSGVLKAIATGATGVKTPVGVNVGGSSSGGHRVSWRELIQ